MQRYADVRRLVASDAEAISSAFAATGWLKPREQYERYLAEQAEGRRVVLVAHRGPRICGYVTVVWESSYKPFRLESIPEIQDLNVLPHYRRRGIATHLLDEAEELIGQRSPIAGIGVGLYADYGAAQRLYVQRGYVPDGHGVSQRDRIVLGGETVVAADNLVLHLRKHLRAG